jgi:hypothetical protein
MVSKVSSFFYLFSPIVTSKLCCLKDFGTFKHLNVESFCHITIVVPKRTS